MIGSKFVPQNVLRRTTPIVNFATSKLTTEGGASPAVALSAPVLMETFPFTRKLFPVPGNNFPVIFHRETTHNTLKLQCYFVLWSIKSGVLSDHSLYFPC